MVDTARPESQPSLRGRLAHARAAVDARLRRLESVPGLHALTGAGRRRRHILQHSCSRRAPAVDSVIVPDRAPGPADVEAATRLLAAYQTGEARAAAHPSGSRPDVWTMIGQQQTGFAAVVERGDPQLLARYLCNVSRHDASVGIVQGDGEYERVVRDPGYRDFLALIAKDKLVSLAEAVGHLPVENPEQGVFATNLHADADALVAGIAQRVGIDITPPEIDGGLLKLRTRHGLFGERDANAIFTAWLLRRLADRLGGSGVCEIGGGSGRVAYWSRRLGLGPYTIVDLPTVNCVQAYYLLASLPDDAIALYGEGSPQAAPDVTVWPSHALDELPQQTFSIVLNQDSMPEMDRETVDEYLRWCGRVCTGLFVSINHESRPAYGGNLRHVSVPEAAAAVGGLELVDRYPYWLRRGYVVELYRPTAAGAA